MFVGKVGAYPIEDRSVNSSACVSLLYRLSVYPTQASLFGLLITFVNNLNLNLALMFVYYLNESSVINLIYSKKLILLHSIQEQLCRAPRHTA